MCQFCSTPTFAVTEPLTWRQGARLAIHRPRHLQTGLSQIKLAALRTVPYPTDVADVAACLKRLIFHLRPCDHISKRPYRAALVVEKFSNPITAVYTMVYAVRNEYSPVSAEFTALWSLTLSRLRLSTLILQTDPSVDHPHRSPTMGLHRPGVDVMYHFLFAVSLFDVVNPSLALSPLTSCTRHQCFQCFCW